MPDVTTGQSTAGLTKPGIFALSRATLFLGAIAGVFLCFALRELRVGSWELFVVHAPRMMVFPWGVFAVALWRTNRANRATPASAADAWIMTLLAVACIPLAAEASLVGIGVATGALGLFILCRSQPDANLRAAGICLLALSGNFALAPVIFKLFYGSVIAIDMALLTVAIDLTGAPVTATPAGLVADDGLRVLLVGGCSSFMGISAAVLVHMGWAMAVRTHVGWRDGIAITATVLLATLLNIVRLTLTASGHDGYAFWHGGPDETPLGGQIFWFLQNAILLTGGYLSASWAGRPVRPAP